MGYRIVESYYSNSNDKSRAIREIIGMTDAKVFLDRSGYGQRMD